MPHPVRLPCVAASVLLLSACAAPAGGPLPAADHSALLAVKSTYDPRRLPNDSATTLAPDAVLLPAGQQPIQGLDAIRAFWWPDDGSVTEITGYTTTTDEVDGSGDVAWPRGTAELSFTWSKDTTRLSTTSRSMSLTVYRRGADGTWRIARRVWGNRGG